ncbi:hypothetical protein [Nonomuraea sp. NPDC050310]|uniref:hypothetical protein n=1 Tax=unclassified Nonomuraea TaxID=2593643 RepID=UPI00340769CF
MRRRLIALLLPVLLAAGCGLSPGDVTSVAVPAPVVQIPPLPHRIVLYKYGRPVLAPVHLRNADIDELMKRLFDTRRRGYETAMAEMFYDWANTPPRSSEGSPRDLDSRRTTLQVFVYKHSKITEKAALQITCTAVRNWENLLRVEIYRGNEDDLYGSFRCRDDLTLIRE